MTIITSPIAPPMTRRPPAGPASLGALLEAIRRLLGRRTRRAREMSALRRLVESDEALLRDIGVSRDEIRRWIGGAAPQAARSMRWG